MTPRFGFLVEGDCIFFAAEMFLRPPFLGALHFVIRGQAVAFGDEACIRFSFFSGHVRKVCVCAARLKFENR